MRRAGPLFDRVADPENLRLAFWKASRGKRHRPDVAAFRERLADELDGLRRDLEAGGVAVGDYRTFVIRDPKERTICAAPFRERVLHQAVMNACEPALEAYQIHHSYACRPAKGVHAAVERARRWSTPRSWFLKLDVRKYFDSVDHAVLLGLLERRFKDRRLLALLARIVASYETAPGKGLPIGNLTSQHFANHYLAVLDHFVKEGLGVRRYLRYMDDLLLWSDDRQELKAWHRAVAAFAGERLLLELKPPVFGPCGRGVPALGYRVFPRTVRLLGRSALRFRRKLAACERRLARGAVTEAEAALRVQPLLGFVGHAATRGLRRSAAGAASEARTG